MSLNITLSISEIVEIYLMEGLEKGIANFGMINHRDHLSQEKSPSRDVLKARALAGVLYTLLTSDLLTEICVFDIMEQSFC